MMAGMQTYLLEDHSTDDKRDGEGAVVALRDGSLFFVYGRFAGGGDASPAVLVSRVSTDGGGSWSEAKRFFDPEPGWINVMSVSLLRLHDDRLAALFLVKLDANTCVPYWTTSTDDSVTWTPPQRIVSNGGYYVVNNDRLVQLADGRLLVPYAFSTAVGNCSFPLSGCLISDDAGQTWRHGKQEIAVEPEHYRLPAQVVADATPALRLFGYRQICTQEPGAVELADGRILMWARSNGGYAYASTSTDRGEHWLPYRVLCDTPMANGPATIKRVPGTQRLVMLHNDRSGTPYGSPTFPWRTPLAVSVSDDEGATWKAHAPLLGDDSHNYCYYSLCFFGGRSLVTTYESANATLPNGTPVRHNLRSLRVVVVDNAWWLD